MTKSEKQRNLEAYMCFQRGCYVEQQEVGQRYIRAMPMQGKGTHNQRRKYALQYLGQALAIRFWEEGF